MNKQQFLALLHKHLLPLGVDERNELLADMP
jgi:uncharacterized membrane protein